MARVIKNNKSFITPCSLKKTKFVHHHFQFYKSSIFFPRILKRCNMQNQYFSILLLSPPVIFSPWWQRLPICLKRSFCTRFFNLHEGKSSTKFCKPDKTPNPEMIIGKLYLWNHSNQATENSLNGFNNHIRHTMSLSISTFPVPFLKKNYSLPKDKQTFL